MFDPFTTGKPLTLHLEVEIHSAAGSAHVDLLGLASPAARDAKIWIELEKFRSSWKAVVSSIDAPLNHLFVVPDQKTFDSISSSKFLRDEFSVFEERTTQRNDMSYTGIYFYGKNTYFEFLPPETSAGMPEGATGIAWGFETPGAAGNISEKLKAKEFTTFDGPVTRKLNDVEIPWLQFLGIQPAHDKSKLSLFAMEYKPEFLEEWNGDLPPAAPSIARGAILSRYAANLNRDCKPTAVLFEDLLFQILIF